MICLYYFRIPHFPRCGNKKINFKYRAFGHPEYCQRCRTTVMARKACSGWRPVWWPEWRLDGQDDILMARMTFWWPEWHSDGRYNSLVDGGHTDGRDDIFTPGYCLTTGWLSEGGVINKWPGWHYDGLRMMWLEIRLIDGKDERKSASCRVSYMDRIVPPFVASSFFWQRRRLSVKWLTPVCGVFLVSSGYTIGAYAWALTK